MIVWLVTRARQNETNKKTEIMLKAIESGATIDANFFKEKQGAKQGAKTIKERLLKRLAGGCIFTLMGVVFTVIGFVNKDMMTEIHMHPASFTIPCIFGGIFFAIGIGLLIVFFVGKKMLLKEMEAEAKEIEQK
jgi:putative Mn2+ efflux pump MntP